MRRRAAIGSPARPRPCRLPIRRGRDGPMPRVNIARNTGLPKEPAAAQPRNTAQPAGMPAGSGGLSTEPTPLLTGLVGGYSDVDGERQAAVRSEERRVGKEGGA